MSGIEWRLSHQNRPVSSRDLRGSRIAPPPTSQRTSESPPVIGLTGGGGGGGGAIVPPVRSRELTGRFRWDKRHSISLTVNFQTHY